MPFKDKTKRNEYQRNYKKKQNAELKELRKKLVSSVQKDAEKQ